VGDIGSFFFLQNDWDQSNSSSQKSNSILQNNSMKDFSPFPFNSSSSFGENIVCIDTSEATYCSGNNNHINYHNRLTSQQERLGKKHADLRFTPDHIPISLSYPLLDTDLEQLEIVNKSEHNKSVKTRLKLYGNIKKEQQDQDLQSRELGKRKHRNSSDTTLVDGSTQMKSACPLLDCFLSSKPFIKEKSEEKTDGVLFLQQSLPFPKILTIKELMKRSVRENIKKSKITVNRKTYQKHPESISAARRI
jgi:hypothetical protein